MFWILPLLSAVFMVVMMWLMFRRGARRRLPAEGTS